MGIVFTIMNKGTWSGRKPIIDALGDTTLAIVGALAGGQLAGHATEPTVNPDGTVNPPQSTPIGPWWAALLGLGLLGIWEGLNFFWADCDGWVVNATMKIGKTELDQNAVQSPWWWTTLYPGDDSPEGCGDNSNYSVDYEIAATSLEVKVPNVVDLSPGDAFTRIKSLGLMPEVRRMLKGNVQQPRVVAQDPQPGVTVTSEATVMVDVEVWRGGPRP